MTDQNKIWLENSMNREWTTFENKVGSFATIDHQHLSNCYYHWKYAVNGYLDMPYLSRHQDQKLEVIMFALEKRFDGKILPYSPHVRFKDEIAALKKAGYLQPDGKIIADGKEIGEVSKTIEMDGGEIIAFEDPFKQTKQS